MQPPCSPKHWRKSRGGVRILTLARARRTTQGRGPVFWARTLNQESGGPSHVFDFLRSGRAVAAGRETEKTENVVSRVISIYSICQVCLRVVPHTAEE